MQHYNNIELIETEASLIDFYERVKNAQYITLDTEFIRESTYYPKLCLMQACAEETIACIDPLRIKDLTPLWQLMFDNHIIKVFHAARQDLEIVYHLQHSLPDALFDTQLAAPLLGYPEQIGYATLVKEILHIDLAKAHTRTDWQKRPLSTAQLQYAADDVFHLRVVYENIRQRLADLGRLEWLEDDLALLKDPATYDPDPAEAWIHVRDIYKFNGRSLAIIQALASWREITAKHDNLPRNWLMRDEVLTDIAKLGPSTTEQLGQVQNIPKKIAEHYAKSILDIVMQSANNTPVPLPDFKRLNKLSPEQEALLDRLQLKISDVATNLNISATVIASKKTLKRIVLGESPERLLTGWRKNLLCEDIKNLL